MKVVVEDKAIIAKENNDCIGLSPQTVRVRTTIHTKPNSVTLTQSNYIMGRNQHSDKLWGRWKNSGLASVYRTSTGKIAFLSRDNKGKPMGGTEAMYHVRAANRHPEFREALAYFGIETYADVYPALGIFADGNNRVDFALLSEFVNSITSRPLGFGVRRTRRNFGFLHNDDPRELVSAITRMPYRKDVARALRGKCIPRHSIIKMAGYIDPSWAADFIASLSSESMYALDWIPNAAVQHERGFITRDTYRKMVIEGRNDITSTVPSTFVSDAFRMSRQLLTPRESRRLFKENNLDDIHRMLTDMTNAKKDERLAQPIHYSDAMERIDGATVGKYTVALAKTAAEVKNWGRVQNHCIGSYAEDSYDGRYVHAAVMEGDKMVANFQLSDERRSAHWTPGPSMRMTQIYGHGNSLFAGAKEIYNYLVENKYIVESRVSGIPGSLTAGEQRYIRGVQIEDGAIRADRLVAGRIRV